MNILRLCHEFYSKNNLKIGLSPHFYELSTNLKKQGIQQTVLTTATDSDNIEGIKVIKFSQKPPFSYLMSGITAAKEIKKIKENFDIIHFHNPSYALMATQKKILPPIIMTLHGSPVEINRNSKFFPFRQFKEDKYFYYLSKFAAKRISAVTCVSPGVSESIVKEFNIPKEKVFTITTGVNTKLFKPLKNEETIDLLYTGRLVPKKQPILFLQLILELKKENNKIKALMIGANETDLMYSETLKSIKNNSLEKNVEVKKAVPQKELVNYYNSAKILALTSYSESSPKVILEAMACGKPILTTDILGNKDISINEKTGFVVPVNNLKKLTEKAKYLLENESERKKMGSFAVNYMEKKFTWEKIAKEYIELYKKIGE